jgi:hypothetical protein
MGRACSTNGDKRNAYRILVGKPDGKRPLGRPRWVDNIKMDHREIGLNGMDWFDWLKIGTSEHGKQGSLGVPTGKHPEDSSQASVEAMQWVLLYLSTFKLHSV